MRERLEDRERSRESTEDRIALLLARRRVGRLDDDRLFLAASLGDPAARALWTPQLPDEEGLLNGELAPFFKGVEESRRRAWEKARGEATWLQMRCLDAAWQLPRLRRLYPKVVGAQLRWSHCEGYPYSSGPIIAEEGGRLRVRRPLQREGEVLLETEDPSEAAGAAAATLPEQPRPVWRGSQQSLPLARARLGLFNDILGDEGVMAAVFRWPIMVGRRAALALAPEVQAFWDADRAWDGRLAASFAASRSRVLNAEDQALVPAAREAAHEARLAAVEARRQGQYEASTAGFFAAVIPEHLKTLSGLSAAIHLLGAELAFEIIRKALIAWALGEDDPLQGDAPQGRRT